MITTAPHRLGALEHSSGQRGYVRFGLDRAFRSFGLDLQTCRGSSHQGFESHSEIKWLCLPARRVGSSDETGQDEFSVEIGDPDHEPAELDRVSLRLDAGRLQVVDLLLELEKGAPN